MSRKKKHHNQGHSAVSSGDVAKASRGANGTDAITLTIGAREVTWSLLVLAIGAALVLWSSDALSTPTIPEVDHASSLWLIFLTGLSVGGLSCLAVQGGLLGAMLAKRESNVDAGQQTALQRGVPVVQFLAAKTAAYAVLGALLGAFGSLIPISVQGWLMIAAGVFMVIVVLQMFDLHPVFRRFAVSPPKSVQRYIRSQSKSGGRTTPYVLGALTVFIPCGVTLAMEALAIAANDPVRGALIMTAFTLGTAPVFLVLGLAATQLSKSANKAFRAAASVAIVVVAGISIMSGARLLGLGAAFVSGETAAATLVTEEALAAGAEVADSGSGLAESGAGASQGAYQEATINVATGVFHPSVVQVKAGIPTRLSLNTKETRGCIRAFVIPSLDIQAILPETGTHVVELPAAEPGRIPFMCSMGMYTGVIEVVN